MKLDIDVYISYAHLDNLEPTEGGQGWVEAFRRALETRLTQLQGREPIVVLEELRANDVITDEVINKVKRAGAFVAIVSPRYVASEWARKELELFAGMQAARGLSGNPPIFKVMKAPVPLDEQPTELRSFLGYDFFAVDADTGASVNSVRFSGMMQAGTSGFGWTIWLTISPACWRRARARRLFRLSVCCSACRHP